MPLAYSRFNLRHNFALAQATLGGDDAIDSGQIFGYADVRPVGKIEKWLDGGKAVVAEFEDEEAARLQMLRAACAIRSA